MDGGDDGIPEGVEEPVAVLPVVVVVPVPDVPVVASSGVSVGAAPGVVVGADPGVVCAVATDAKRKHKAPTRTVYLFIFMECN